MAIEETVLMENVRIMFKNFAGKERPPFNSEGDRNFCIFLEPEQAEAMRADGWNIKSLRQREEDDFAQQYIQVAVSYGKGRPPRAVLITSRGRQELGADEVEIFDWADIKSVDVIIRAYNWEVNGNKGKKAYLKSIFVTINEDPLDLKYAGIQRADEPLPPTPAEDNDDD